MKCRSCGVEIFFATLNTGKSMPMDAVPVENGNFVLDKHGTYRVVLTSESSPGEPRYLSHFATCSNPEKHRRKRQ